jgi:diguanylate cyclase (GGDEF)-like protein
MSVLGWVDNRTLLGCQLLMAGIYASFVFGMRRLYGRVAGTGSFAASYLVGVLGCILIVARGAIPDLFSIVLGNSLLFTADVFFLIGTVEFFDIRKSSRPAWSWAGLASLAIAYFTLVHNEIVPRIVICGITTFVLRGLVSYHLYRQSTGRPLIRFFSYTMGIYAIFGINRAITTFTLGAPANFIERNTVQTLSMVVTTAFSSVLGLLLLFMLSSELLTRVQDESQQDSVTGILNRRGVDLKLALELKRIDRSGQHLSVAFIDIDNFKSVNDSLGHAGGDEALRQVSAVIAGRLRAYDLLGRYGGDEFLLVLPQTSWSDALIVCRRLEQAIQKLSIKGVNLTISTGITQAVPTEDTNSLLARADKALYIAKNNGRNHCRVVLDDPNHHSSDPSGSRSYIAIPAAADDHGPLPQPHGAKLAHT